MRSAATFPVRMNSRVTRWISGEDTNRSFPCPAPWMRTGEAAAHFFGVGGRRAPVERAAQKEHGHA